MTTEVNVTTEANVAPGTDAATGTGAVPGTNPKPTRSPRDLLARLRRKSSGKFIAEIDGMRFLAIMPVVLMHLDSAYSGTAGAELFEAMGDPLAHPVWSILYAGGHGVLLFFVISGFIIAQPLLKAYRDREKSFSYKDFLLRRIVRLEPPYILCLLLSYIGYVVVWGADAWETLPRLAASMVYMHSFIYGEFNPMNPVTWSLEIELQFYLLAPVFASVFLIRPTWFRRLVLVAIIAAWVYVGRLVIEWEPYNLQYSLLPFGYYFLLGFLLADVLKSPGRPRPHLAFDLMAIAGLVLIYGESRPIYDALYYVMLFIGVFHSHYAIRFLQMPIVYLIGGMCYTIYLYHLPLFFALSGVFGGLLPFQTYELNYLLLAAICLPIALMLMSIAYLVMERPFMNVDLQALKRRLARLLPISSHRPA